MALISPLHNSPPTFWLSWELNCQKFYIITVAWVDHEGCKSLYFHWLQEEHIVMRNRDWLLYIWDNCNHTEIKAMSKVGQSKHRQAHSCTRDLTLTTLSLPSAVQSILHRPPILQGCRLNLLNHIIESCKILIGSSVVRLGLWSC